MSDLIRSLTCNSPKRTPDHPRKSHIVKACKDGQEKIVRFGQQGAEGVGAGEVDAKLQKKREGYNRRLDKLFPNPDFFSPAYWSKRVKWN
jgi:hypothetical protein